MHDRILLRNRGVTKTHPALHFGLGTDHARNALAGAVAPTLQSCASVIVVVPMASSPLLWV